MSRSSVNKVKILVVEDEPGIRQVCHRVLTDQGYLVDFANNGAVAESMILKEDYNLILIDIRTPVKDGKQLNHYIEDT